jgi:hypothetical protein
VAIGDDVAPSPSPSPSPAHPSRRDRALYDRTLAELSRRGWHPAVAAIEAALTVARMRAAHERRREP